MGAASYSIMEWRVLIEDELTQVYARIEAHGDCPIGVHGWHHKTFPASKSVVDILQGIVRDSPVLWAQEAPPHA